MCVCVRVRAYVCVQVQACVFVSVNINVRVHTCVRVNVFMCTRTTIACVCCVDAWLSYISGQELVSGQACHPLAPHLCSLFFVAVKLHGTKVAPCRCKDARMLDARNYFFCVLPLLLP